MWTLTALVTATVLIPSITIIGLFYLGILKRVEDLTPQRVDEWAAAQDRKIPATVPFEFEGLEQSETQRV
jgi:hypothetical protein